MATITLNGISWDPTPTGRDPRPVVPEAADASGTNYILVQLRTLPLTAEQREQLGSRGVEVGEYVPDDTYLCRYAPADLAGIRALPFVQWADVYRPGFKVPPGLRSSVTSTQEMAVSGVSRSPSRRQRQVDIVLHDGVAPAIVRAQVAGATGVDPDDIEISRDKIRLTVQEDQLADLADLDEVRSIAEAPRRQLFNNVARRLIGAESVGVGDTLFEGEGQIVAVADTGFDRGSTEDVHPAFSGRVHSLVAFGRPKQTNDPKGHGTHVAGSVLGDGTSPSMGGPIRGTAPRAQLLLQSLLDSSGRLGGIPVDLRDLFEPAYEAGARVHTNSWGATQPGRPYDNSAREIDAMVWDQPDLVICFAAGNSGTDSDANGTVDAGSVGSEAAAKNCITVGATENDRPEFAHTYGEYWPDDFPAKPLSTDAQADDPEGMVAFSSRGPTKEGRIKPDVVAPGTCILSALSRAVKNPSNVFGDSSDPLYFFDSGTSMATPLVAGCVAVLREALLQNGVTPSAALVKALLINGAVPVKGQFAPSEAAGSPNNNAGFGRVDLAGAIITASDGIVSGFVDGRTLEQGDDHSFTVTIPQTVAPSTIKVSLVWTDPPGPALQNDLDLVVTSDGEERHGNMGTSSGFDRVNNVEQVVWRGIPAGPAQVAVRAFRITTGPQPFACVWRVS